MPEIVPEVHPGLVVHYRSLGSAAGRHPSVCRAAIVTELFYGATAGISFPDEYASLAVLNPGGIFFDRDVARSNDLQPGTWHHIGHGGCETHGLTHFEAVLGETRTEYREALDKLADHGATPFSDETGHGLELTLTVTEWAHDDQLLACNTHGSEPEFARLRSLPRCAHIRADHDGDCEPRNTEAGSS